MFTLQRLLRVTSTFILYQQIPKQLADSHESS